MPPGSNAPLLPAPLSSRMHWRAGTLVLGFETLLEKAAVRVNLYVLLCRDLAVKGDGCRQAKSLNSLNSLTEGK